MGADVNNINCRRIKTAAALTSVICIILAATVSGTRSNESRNFREFFIRVVAGDTEKDNFVPNRWGSPLQVCVYGDPSETSRTRILRLLSLIRASSALDIEATFQGDIGSCADTTFMYMRIHSGGQEVKLLIIEDLASIMRRVDANKPIDADIDTDGMGLVFANDQMQPFAYVAASQFDKQETEFDGILANNVVQQEVVQVLLAARDIRVEKSPRSLVEERRPDLAIDGHTGVEPQYRSEWVTKNVHNVCLYDLMAIKTLYSRDSMSTQGDLNFYKEYIDRNYSVLKSEAETILSDPFYKFIIKEKC